jgi:hypothetical protein
MPIIVFGCVTPITRKLDWLICTLRPTGSASPNRSLASSSPSTSTRRLSRKSMSSMKRPPGCG